MNSKLKDDNKVLLKPLEWVINIDIPEIEASLSRERKYHLSKKELALSIFKKAKWNASASGAMTGFATNPLIVLPSATLDVVLTLRTEVSAAAKVALIYNKDFFANENAKWELLIPIFAMHKQKNHNNDSCKNSDMTTAALKRYITKESLIQFQIIMLKFFTKKVAGRSILTKSIPVIGGAIGGLWNFVEVEKLKDRVIKYFEELEKVQKG